MSDIMISRTVEVDDAAPYIDWSTVVAGSLVAIAIITILTAFGTAIGLSMTAPFGGQGFSNAGVTIAVSLWTLWVIISGSLAGGYVAGRMRHLGIDTSEHEAELRNGAHGLVTWALTTIVVAILTALVFTGAQNVRGASQDHARYVGDQLLRGGRPDLVLNDGVHREVASILRTAETKPIAPEDRTYLVRVATGPNGDSAEARVDGAINDVVTTARSARRAGVLAGFLTAAALAIGAAAAWFAATAGGSHRRDYRGISIFTRWH